jgi:hypothetical protein
MENKLNLNYKEILTDLTKEVKFQFIKISKI